MSSKEVEIRQAIEDYYKDRNRSDPPDFTTSDIRFLLAIIDDLRSVIHDPRPQGV